MKKLFKMKDPLNILSFNTEIMPNIKIIGGKALSLIKLTKLNRNVPPGIILTVNFFSDWLFNYILENLVKINK